MEQSIKESFSEREGFGEGREESRVFESSESRSVNKLSFTESGGVFPTYFVFLDFPKHIEFRFQDLPLLQEGTKVDFDLTIKNPLDLKKSRKINGTYVINRSILKIGGKRSGLTQYLEWKLIK